MVYSFRQPVKMKCDVMTDKENTAVSLTSSTQSSSALKLQLLQTWKKSGTGETLVRSGFKIFVIFFSNYKVTCLLTVSVHSHKPREIIIYLVIVRNCMLETGREHQWSRETSGTLPGGSLAGDNYSCLSRLSWPSQSEQRGLGSRSKISGVGRTCCVSLAFLSAPSTV